MDIRWAQRFDNYRRALARLSTAITKVAEQEESDAETSDLLKEGLIQRFEYTHELAWNVMKDYAEYQGYTEIKGSRDAVRKAMQIGIIDSKSWMKSISDRNLTSHNYDEETFRGILKVIIEDYHPLFIKFEETMLTLLHDDEL